MPRPARTYRAARRNQWRADGCPPWWPNRISGSNWRNEFDALILDRPVAPRGWPWKQGGRAVLNKVKAIWRSGASLQDRIAEIRGVVKE